MVKTLFFSKYGPRTGQTPSRPHGHKHVSPDYLWPWDDHWYSFNSIWVMFYIVVNMYHIQLHNEEWNPKPYVPRKPCSHSMSTVAGSSMRGDTMRWTRSELWRQQCTLKGRIFMGWYITYNHKYSLLMHRIKIKSPAKFLLNEQYVFVGGNISFLCVLSCSSEEA